MLHLALRRENATGRERHGGERLGAQRPERIVHSGANSGDLLNAEISEKQARSIKYQLTIAKLLRSTAT
jgi:hypothetical protein